MDMNRTDFTVEKDKTEIWTVENIAMGMMNVPHSFHVHDVQFKVLSLNGMLPPPSYRGLKDTVLLMGGDIIEIQLKFIEYNGLYMYHCHFLEHEDAGMMGQFFVN
jgi:blue copper oxidase